MSYNFFYFIFIISTLSIFIFSKVGCSTYPKYLCIDDTTVTIFYASCCHVGLHPSLSLWYLVTVNHHVRVERKEEKLEEEEEQNTVLFP